MTPRTQPLGYQLTLSKYCGVGSYFRIGDVLKVHTAVTHRRERLVNGQLIIPS